MIRTLQDLTLEAALRTSDALLQEVGCRMAGDQVGAFYWRQQVGIHRAIWRAALAGQVSP